MKENTKETLVYKIDTKMVKYIKTFYTLNNFT